VNALAGKRVLNTRALEQQAALDRLLIERSAIPVSLPCIAIEPLPSTGKLDAELRRVAGGEYEWLLLTSMNASSAIEERVRALDLGISARVGAVGKTTATAVERWLGRAVDVVPIQQQAVALAASLPLTPGDRVLIPASSKARTDLAETLRARGAVPYVVEAYRTVAMADGGWQMTEEVFDAIAFASPSAVEGFAQRLASGGIHPEDLRRAAIGCIGSTTLQAAIAAGFSQAVQGPEETLDGLIAALELGIAAQAEREASRTL
jgi:uroporphyrinogen-III synthase